MASTANAAVWYVKANATGENNGTGWTDAFKELQSALANAQVGDEIWVAVGTYIPDYDVTSGQHTKDRSASFQLTSGVAVYGGFAGFENRRDERDVDTNRTTLSGDLERNDKRVGELTELITERSRNDNSYHVVVGRTVDGSAILDGFTITGGHANGTRQANTDVGGGMLNDAGGATLIMCTFRHNVASGDTESFSVARGGGGLCNLNGSTPRMVACTFEENIATAPRTGLAFGGGMYNQDSSPMLTGCTFRGNVILGIAEGGGMGNWQSHPTLTNCLFIRNHSATNAGGMENTASSPLLINCAFIGNSALNDGGAIDFDLSDATLVNCLFSGNSANVDGGAISHESSGNDGSPGDLTLVNCTIAGNTAGSFGGGFANVASSPRIANTIFWDNTDRGNSLAIAQIYTASGEPVVNHSCVQGGWSGAGNVGNIEDDPSFLNARGTDDRWGTDDDDLRLRPGSPCIDAGDNELVPEGMQTDLSAGVRILDDPLTADSGRGLPPIVDMGAYEFGDCNGNGTSDEVDLDTNASLDCNGNGYPDECERDCNASGFPDDCDIVEGISNDCNTNSIPDECEPDCDANGVADSCDIAAGTSVDVNENGTLDTCEPDCNANGVPDDIDLANGTSRDTDRTGRPDECEVGDFDRDGDIDLADFLTLTRCLNGPNVEGAQGCCRREGRTRVCTGDLDGDVDVDLADLVAFQAIFTGPQ